MARNIASSRDAKLLVAGTIAPPTGTIFRDHRLLQQGLRSRTEQGDMEDVATVWPASSDWPSSILVAPSWTQTSRPTDSICGALDMAPPGNKNSVLSVPLRGVAVATTSVSRRRGACPKPPSGRLPVRYATSADDLCGPRHDDHATLAVSDSRLSLLGEAEHGYERTVRENAGPFDSGDLLQAE